VKAAANISHKPAPLDDVWLGEDPVKDFVKGMTHELHTPLNVIIGFCQLLERDRTTNLSPTQRDAVQRMERNAHSLLQTVDHLLACLRTGHFD
jgi:signal transduction histidine kinase